MSDIDDNIAAGASTVGQALGFDPIGEQVAAPVEPPRHEDQPAFPSPGIYFDMPDEEYHAIHACSASGLKKLATSSMDYWANSVLNAEREETDEKENKYLALGKAYHKRIVEGLDAYLQCYAVELDKASFGDELLVTTDEVKAAIIADGGKPVTRVPVDDIVVTDGSDVPMRAARKEDWIAQLLWMKPTALVWDALVHRHLLEHAGKTFISVINDRRIQIAARMIEAHPELQHAFTGGWPEVSIFWYCRETGAPMKARLDYLAADRIVDLKSFSNKVGKPIDRAIESAIASNRYNIQHVVYDEAVAWLRANFTADLVHGNADQHEWTMLWAKEAPDPSFMFVFQQTGIAPVTRGKIMPRVEMGVFGVTRRRVAELKRSFVANCEVYGTDPWLDIRPVEEIDDADIPLWACEI